MKNTRRIEVFIEMESIPEKPLRKHSKYALRFEEYHKTELGELVNWGHGYANVENTAEIIRGLYLRGADELRGHSFPRPISLRFDRCLDLPESDKVQIVEQVVKYNAIAQKITWASTQIVETRKRLNRKRKKF